MSMDFKERVEQAFLANKFCQNLGMKLENLEKGSFEASLDVEDRHLQQSGLVHGGVISTLCDAVAGFSAYSLTEPPYYPVTGEIKITYFKPGLPGRIYAKGKVIKAGSKVHFCEAELYQESEGEMKLLAKASTTMVIIEKK